MLYDPAHAAAIKSWLTSHLEPICDADPEVLADYVVALLKNDADAKTMEETLTEQLQDFLGDSTGTFAHETVQMLSTRSYQPQAGGASGASTSAAGAGDADTSMSRKRRAPSEDASMADDARDGAKQLRTDGAPGRMGGGPGHEGGAGDAWSSRRVSGQPPSDGMDGMNGPARPRLPPGMCRDFHIRGFCARGDSCKYTHLPPAMSMPPGPLGGAPGHGPRRGLPGSNGGPQGPPRAGDVEMGNGPEMGPGGPVGGMPGMPPGSMPPQMSMEQMQQMAAQFGFPGMPGMPMMPAFGPGGPSGPGGGDRGRRPPRGKQGYFPNRPAKSATTLVIENLPAENLDLIQINDRFKRFGTITNIQIDKAGRKALVSYSEPDEAKAAHSDPDAVFGSRFVKVYFQRLEEQPQQGGPGGPQQQQQQQPHQRGPPSWNAPSASAPSYSRPAIVTEADVRMMQTDAKAKQSSLDALLEEQKTLMGGISTMDADAKKNAMTRLRELSTAIPAATQQARQAAEKVQNVGPITPIPEASKALLVAKAKKQQLDRELDAISKGGGMQVDGDGEGAEGQTTEELKAKLESLKAEAASLGLDASGAPIRGAGRGRGRFTTRGGYAPRGRGGFQRGFASLDNRTKELRIDATTESGEAIQGDKRKNVETWLKTFGEIESLADGQDGKLVVVWKNRHEGDKAVWSGGNVPDVGKIQMQWAPQTAAAPAGGSTPMQSDEPVANGGSS